MGSRGGMTQQPVPLVAGGYVAAVGEFPYMVQIQDHVYSHLCGGSILSSYLILTAAHCFFNDERERRRNETFYVVAGKYFRSSRTPTEQHREIEEIIIHPHFDQPDPLDNDIALIVLKRELDFNRYVASIQLSDPVVEKDFKGSAIVSGWGFFENYMVSSALRKATVEIQDFDHCESFWPGEMTGKMCAQTPASSGTWIDVCSGDSGGPLKCLHARDKFKNYLCGVVSAGYNSREPGDGHPPCGRNHSYPVYYTQVSYYRDWIISETEHIRPLYKCPQGYFQCQNYLCVTNDSKCDGFDDCGDGSDECCETSSESSPTTTTTTTTDTDPCGPIFLQCKGMDLSDCKLVEDAPDVVSSVVFLQDIEVGIGEKQYINDALIFVT